MESSGSAQRGRMPAEYVFRDKYPTMLVRYCLALSLRSLEWRGLKEMAMAQQKYLRSTLVMEKTERNQHVPVDAYT